ncbi:Zn(II)2Cys6 transcription factor [Aspergillus homomorphus CBS 101889]|uniref:Zn(2)-C6 fungal-type domain-containing protein n=1 Tax=Aspergillus homomorphus (strain CBS 101889) TaxID=1450537 RepID=A0A395HQI0_ASPHC|nr:hypothetical protein BO97DRAFT_144157 [Aspergillus homomorphus CBS 101889]RAL10202.1 hypothetical protein BO97DRAFT_144157 [Aspergillus homomorphus CBS 101889]
MVNHGRSGGCVTCKTRRVKCDEARPECQSCQRLSLRCGGYKTKPVRIRFKDQNPKFFCTKSAPRKALQDRCSVPDKLRSLAQPDPAVPFFLQHYAIMGRDMESTRGFFEILVPVYGAQRQDSALSLAVSAVASEILSLWRHGSSSRASQETYTQALKGLRRTMQDPGEWGKPETMLAVLALQFYENLAVIYGRHSSTRAHHDGAVSLLPFASSDDKHGAISAYIQRYIIHSEISSAIRQKRLLRSTAHSCLGSKGPLAAPASLISTLDTISASVAELQASYSLTARNGFVSSSEIIPRDWRAEAKCIDEQLLAWAQNVPEHWQPLRLSSGRDIDPSIPTYESVCEVYLSCQIGTLWNEWRVQRLLLVKIILSSLSANPMSEASECLENADLANYKHNLQDLVDSVCYSVPFYLGNQAGYLSIADFTDPAILLPSYHLLASVCKSGCNQRRPNPQVSEEEHRSHIIAQGPWHIMNPLSRLLTFFWEDHGQAMAMASLLRPGQHEWIREQFLRVTILLRIPLADGADVEGTLYPFDSSAQGNVDSRVEHLAKRIRKGAFL